MGSEDFENLMSDLDFSLDYSRAKSRGSHDDAARLHMQQKVRRRVLQFLLARFILLNLLVDEASAEGGLRQSDHRHLWVLLQARPIDMLKGDAFAELSKVLGTSSVNDLVTQIEDEYRKLEWILEEINHFATDTVTHRPLYCFLDEIQTTTADRMGEFLSEDKKKERPLLRPIWKSITGTLGQEKILVILSGTAIDEKSLQDFLSSTLFKFRQYDIVKDIGAFNDQQTQRQYIEHYLPNDQSEARQEFLNRAWVWCRGR